MFSEKPGVAKDRAVWSRLLRQIATLSGRPQDASDYLNDDDNLNLGYGEDLSQRRAEMKKGLTFYFNIIYKP